MGIPLASNFDIGSPIPIDSRMVVADLTARDAISAGRRYLGMAVHVVDSGAGVAMNYQLVGGILNANWVEFAGGGGGAALEFSDDIQSGDITLVPITKCIRILGDGLTNIDSVEGCEAPASPQELTIFNHYGQTLIIKHDAHPTDPTFSFFMPGAAAGDVFLDVNCSASFIYDDLIDRWVLTALGNIAFISSTTVKMGNSSGVLDIVAFQGIGGISPSLRYDTGIWSFSNDGGSYFPMGQSTPLVTTYTGDQIIDALDEICLMDASSGNIIVSLPDAVGFKNKLTIKKIDTTSATITIDVLAASGQLIDGAAAYVIYDGYHLINLVSNGSNWSII